MHTSAFGVEHWETGEISKGDKTRAEGYRKTRNTLAGMGGTAAGLGAVTAGISRAEAKGRDPMGFTLPDKPSDKPMTAKGRARLLGINAAGHAKQAKVAGGIGVAGLGLSAAYNRAHKQERKKVHKALAPDTKRKARDAAIDTGTVGLGGAAIAGGAYNTKFLGGAARAYGEHAAKANRQLRNEKKGYIKLTAKQKKYYKTARVSAGRTAGLKGAGVAASLGVGGLGGKAIYDVGNRNVKQAKKGKS